MALSHERRGCGAHLQGWIVLRKLCQHGQCLLVSDWLERQDRTVPDSGSGSVSERRAGAWVD